MQLIPSFWRQRADRSLSEYCYIGRLSLSMLCAVPRNLVLLQTIKLKSDDGEWICGNFIYCEICLAVVQERGTTRSTNGQRCWMCHHAWAVAKSLQAISAGTTGVINSSVCDMMKQSIAIVWKVATNKVVHICKSYESIVYRMIKQPQPWWIMMNPSVCTNHISHFWMKTYPVSWLNHGVDPHIIGNPQLPSSQHGATEQPGCIALAARWWFCSLTIITADEWGPLCACPVPCEWGCIYSSLAEFTSSAKSPRNWSSTATKPVAGSSCWSTPNSKRFNAKM